MRMSKDHYDRFEADCLKTLEAFNLKPAAVDTTRKAWDLMDATNGYWLYKHGYTDAHIETAMVKMFGLARELA